MKKTLIFALAMVSAAGFANTFDVSFGTVNTTGTAATTLNGSSTATGVRGYYFSGNWSVIVNATQWSSEFRVNPTPVGGSPLGAFSVGGVNTSANFAFGAVGSTWDNTSAGSTANPADYLSGQNFNGNFTVGFSQTFGATQQSQVTNSVIHLLTDYITPVNALLSPNSPTWTRPASLTSAGTGTSSSATSNISIADAGTYMVGASYLTAAGGGFDGYLYLYSGAFNPLTPLVNLIGRDDDGLASGFGSSAMLLNLAAGNYTMVYSTFSTSGAITSDINVTGYVAGGAAPVPEPATIAVLSVGALAFLRKRRKV